LQHGALEFLLLGAGLEIDISPFRLNRMFREITRGILQVIETEYRDLLAGQAE
jgi:hypothetical protein